MSIDNKTTTEVKTLVTDAATTEASFRTGLDHMIDGLDNIVESQVATPSAGTAGQFLTSDGAGNLSWTTVPSVTVNQTSLLFYQTPSTWYTSGSNYPYTINMPRMSFMPEIRTNQNVGTYTGAEMPRDAATIQNEWVATGGTYPSATYTCRLHVQIGGGQWVNLNFEYITL
ncbi:MAG: hypothetical protein NZ811_02795 [Gammaproteobacteria bacterium]|nr:hypothetical protein [Gammaproteobacteria bacterium]